MKLRKKLALTVLLLVLIRVFLLEANIIVPHYIYTTYHLVQGGLCGIACYSLYLEKGVRSIYPIVAVMVIVLAMSLAAHSIIGS
jgi:uncharacterized membrane protein AbrB (regulator of aidB expression)